MRDSVSFKRGVKMNYIYAKVDSWAWHSISKKTDSSVTFAGVTVSIDHFGEKLIANCRENIKLNRKPIQFNVNASWNLGGNGTHVSANNIAEAAKEVVQAFMWCIESKTSKSEFDKHDIDELEFKAEPIQFEFAF